MSGRKEKQAIFNLLKGQNREQVLDALALYPAEVLVNPLFSAIYRTETPFRWYAVSAFGQALNRLADQDMEAARMVMRRFLWSLNDESGGIGWGAPESMAEAMALHQGLADEYIHMLISYTQGDGPELLQDGNYLELPALQQGLLWGISRLSDTRRQMLVERGTGEHIVLYLGAKDATVRGLACWCLGGLEYVEAEAELEKLCNDQAELGLYRNGDAEDVTVGQLAAEAVTKLKK